jgi:ketosteroid isomerase-like protein
VSVANVEIARRCYEAAARGDLEALRECLDPAVKWHGGDESAPGACHNSDDVLEFISQARRSGRIGELLDIIDAGERVVVVLRPAAGAGEEVQPRANLTTFRDGKVIEMVAYETPEDALAAARKSERV